jgi:hypothetical protein
VDLMQPMDMRGTDSVVTAFAGGCSRLRRGKPAARQCGLIANAACSPLQLRRCHRGNGLVRAQQRAATDRHRSYAAGKHVAI